MGVNYKYRNSGEQTPEEIQLEADIDRRGDESKMYCILQIDAKGKPGKLIGPDTLENSTELLLALAFSNEIPNGARECLEHEGYLTNEVIDNNQFVDVFGGGYYLLEVPTRH